MKIVIYVPAKYSFLAFVLIFALDLNTLAQPMDDGSNKHFSGVVVLDRQEDYEAKVIVFKKDAVIITSGHQLRFRAEKIELEGTAEIRSFPGRVPAQGESGRSAGVIIIEAEEVSGGTLIVHNVGEDGGSGFNGAPGPNGIQGQPSGSCNPGGPGGKGADGQPGGNGGNGGKGGLLVLMIGKGKDKIQYDLSGGKSGTAGIGGPGGEGGEGGRPGPFCFGGLNGPNGPNGMPGASGKPGNPGITGRLETALPMMTNGDPEVPEFPWPPPNPSARAGINPQWLRNSNGPTSLGDVSERLSSIFDQAGYSEKSWYSVPKGFALVSRLEQFNEDGTSKDPPERWAAKIKPGRIFSITEYLRRLFTADPGHFRIIVFIVTSQPFTTPGTVEREAAQAWLSNGLNALPKSLAQIVFAQDYKCTALIYEFEQLTRDTEASFKDPSTMVGIDHLQKAKLLEGLQR